MRRSHQTHKLSHKTSPSEGVNLVGIRDKDNYQSEILKFEKKLGIKYDKLDYDYEKGEYQIQYHKTNDVKKK
ncbi:MAG TPA: hypothetical protein PKK00_01570 [Bacteroidales bacterium]|nr:hypothetical protein [Bacteroidales bacterium]HPS16143.1 hypothetical protein [Bacteroidales bacterium]